MSELEWERERVSDLEYEFEVGASSRVLSGTEFQGWSESDFQI